MTSERPATSERQVSMWSGLAEVYTHASKTRRRQFYVVLVLMLIGALAELGTIGSIVPLLALLADGGSATLPGWLAGLFASLTDVTGAHGLLGATLVFVFFAILAGVMRLLLTWMTQEFIYSLAHDLALESQRRILFQPYAFHLDRHSATLAASVDMVEILVLEVVLPLMQMLIAGFIAAVILAALLYMDPFTATIAALTFSSIYIFVSAATGRRLARNSAVIGRDYSERLKIVQESIGGIRDVIIDNSQAMHLSLFKQVNVRLADARASTAFLAAAPRYAIESIGIVIIAAITVLVSGRQGGIAAALPFLGALGLGAQRLLPLVQNVYTGWTTATGNRSSIAQVVSSLELPVAEPAGGPADKVTLRRKISLEKVCFSYPTRHHSFGLKDVAFEIPAGSMLALIGETGSGKTTLADVLMGLLQPTGGRVCVDGVEITSVNAAGWQRGIAHVPQSIFLADSTIARNIALSLPHKSPDPDRIVAAARKAQLHDFIASLPAGYETHVGERGIRLSGGQRQRLGIARAIYKDSTVLVLDEATSALDEVTESAVMGGLQLLRSEGRTIIIVAHRASTIRHCDVVARLDQGKLVAFGSIEEVLGLHARAS